MTLRVDRRAGAGFSLMELMVVMAVMALLAALAAPAVSSLLSSSRLSDATDQVVALLGYARQSAVALNHTVEVRFYQFSDPSIPSSTSHYQAMQVFQFDDDGNAIPLTKVQFLPGQIICDAGSTLSPLLGTSQAKTFNPPLDAQISLPRIGASYTCAAFQFAPSGITTLVATSSWFVTLHRAADGDNLSTPPTNYSTVQIDPVSGSVKTYRP